MLVSRMTITNYYYRCPYHYNTWYIPMTRYNYYVVVCFDLGAHTSSVRKVPVGQCMRIPCQKHGSICVTFCKKKL